MGRKPAGGHIRLFPKATTPYRLVRVAGEQKLEHRVVMEKALGRKLKRNEIVHHKDGNGLNNSPKNLEIMTQADHMKIHGRQRRKWDRKEAIKMRRKGMSLAAIARYYGVSYTIISTVFRGLGIPTINLAWGKYKWPVKKAAQEYKKGISITSLSRKYGVSCPSIIKRFVKMGIYKVQHR